MKRGTFLISTIICLFFTYATFGQGGHLEKRISIRVHQKPLAQVLQEVGKKGDFYFSYNSNILKGDSLVSLDAGNMRVRQALDTLLGHNYEYSESGRYIIIQPKVTVPSSRIYTISGWVVDADTRSRVSRASVYEAAQLVSTLTDSNGFFRLRLRERAAHPVLTVSKELYRDTVLFVREGQDQEYTIIIGSARFAELAPFVVSSRVEKTWLGRWLLSSRQKIQSLNLLDFFANKPIQFSLTPGLGTHGQMGAQVVNKFSLNLLGGYTAGSKGLEMAGIFNLDKNNVDYVQVAGIFNVVGGNVAGVQLAGVHNHVLGNTEGVQASGISNIVGGSFGGVQLAGIYNDVGDSMQGLQASGLINRVKKNMRGVQLAPIANSSRNEMRGLQLSALFNYTKNLKGVQIGLVNIADTSSGYMIGLINITKNGYHPISLSANEILPLNISYKTGSRKTHSILLAGVDPRDGVRAYMLGFGIGSDLALSSRWSVNTELTLQYFYLGNWTGVPVVYRLQSSLQWQLTKGVSLFAGPAFSLYDADHVLPAKGFKGFGNTTGWIGWSAGINFL